MNESYEIYAVRYATVELDYSQVFLNRSREDGFINLDFYFWVIRNRKRTIVVDTGFNAEIAARRGREAIITPSEALRKLQVDPNAVETVIMTHLHYDHAGNPDLFPAATFILQNDELEFSAGRIKGYPEPGNHYESEDIARFEHLVLQGRVKLVTGDVDVAPGISTHCVPGHTLGLQVVKISTSTGPVILANDAVHYYAGMRHLAPFPSLISVRSKLAGYDRVRKLAGDNGRIIAGHDPEVMRFFPTHESDANIVQLHLPPNNPLFSALPHLPENTN